MARFAIDMCVPAGTLLLDDVGVTVFAGVMAGKVHRASCGLTYRVASIMAILAKALGNQVSSHSQEDDPADRKHSGQSEQVPGLFERTHRACLLNTVLGHGRAVRSITPTSLWITGASGSPWPGIVPYIPGSGPGEGKGSTSGPGVGDGSGSGTGPGLLGGTGSGSGSTPGYPGIGSGARRTGIPQRWAVPRYRLLPELGVKNQESVKRVERPQKRR